MTSPAESYAAARSRQARAATELGRFEAAYPFGLDPFQVRACEALQAGDGVLVAAPTGAGKTVVGEFAVHLALSEGRKCFYTTPIKALSNQKYADLVRRYGPDQVGLLTGDNSVNSEAPVVVMTTEVLRNMLYAGSPTLRGLGYVVMDEVHYLSDRFRGAVWEEVIIHLPESVRLVSLSATVSNAEEFGDWLVTVRGHTAVIVEEHRPVPLWQHVLTSGGLYDLFVGDEIGHRVGDEIGHRVGDEIGHRVGDEIGHRVGDEIGHRVDDAHHEVNPELVRLARNDTRAARGSDRRPGRGNRRPGHGGQHPNRVRWPSRAETIARLDAEALLPAITFIFSRVGCDAAVEQCLRSGMHLLDEKERSEVRSYVEARTAQIPDEDLAILGYRPWLDGLERGIAAHHAGMLPTFKEVVEELFVRGLVKAVFATETLALGINMPARTVVLERLVKWNGEAHADVTAGEYTQLTGRAGRRGIDVEGHAVVVWHPGIDPAAVAGLASTRTYPLRSSFRPSYNMAVNLVGQVGRPRARVLLESSFAQFQADRAVVGLARQVRRNEEGLESYRESMTCHLGDFEQYAGLRRAIADREASLSRDGAANRRAAAAASLEKLRPGDVIRVPGGRRAGLAVVLDPGAAGGSDGPRPTVLTSERQVRRLALADFPTPVEALHRLRIPKSFNARDAAQRRDLASALRSSRVADGPGAARRGPRSRSAAADDTELAALRAAMRAHPCHGCAEREDHARWAERHWRLRRETEALERRVGNRTSTISRTFDRITALLEELGYLKDDSVTPAGKRLSAIYSELDLVAAQCLQEGVWTGLEPADLAACVSALVFESRQSDDAVAPRLPNAVVRNTLAEMVRLWASLEVREREHRLESPREPDLGFVWATHRWASAQRLDTVLRESGMLAGDFVRATKQVIDLLGQIAVASRAAGEGPAAAGVASAARKAADLLHRGVVVYTSVA